MPHYDFTGDIHGHAAPLLALLTRLGYQPDSDGYSHPERQVIFVSDYIDRGPAIPKVLRIVKTMVDQGAALALMGNHEYNAICFHTPHPAGGHLRRHTIKNFKQHV